MNTIKPKWNKKIDNFIKLIGGKRAKQVGFYIINRQDVDLTASGDEEWMVIKNILEQLNQ